MSSFLHQPVAPLPDTRIVIAEQVDTLASLTATLDSITAYYASTFTISFTFSLITSPGSSAIVLIAQAATTSAVVPNLPAVLPIRATGPTTYNIGAGVGSADYLSCDVHLAGIALADLLSTPCEVYNSTLQRVDDGKMIELQSAGSPIYESHTFYAGTNAPFTGDIIHDGVHISGQQFARVAGGIGFMEIPFQSPTTTAGDYVWSIEMRRT